MQEVFYEETAQVLNKKSAGTKYYILKIMAIASFVVCAIWFGLVFWLFNVETNGLLLFLVFLIVPTALFFIIGFILTRLMTRYYLSYDYTFVSGEIRISSVSKNNKRKFICKFDAKEIEKIGVYNGTDFFSYKAMPDVEYKFLSSNVMPDEGKGFYYFYFFNGASKKLFVLECSKLFIANVIKFCNKKVLEEGL